MITLVVSNGGILLSPVRPCLIYLVTFTSSTHDIRRYVTLTGTDRFNLTKDKTGGQQGDPLEMLIFNLTIHHLWGRVIAKFPETRVIVNADDGYKQSHRETDLFLGVSGVQLS